MKKLIPVILLVISLSFFSCKVNRDPDSTTVYRYLNQTENVIEMKVYSKMYADRNDSPTEELFIEIPSGDEHKITYIARGTATRDPLYLFGRPAERDSVIISNGSRFVVERRWEKDKIYFRENYEVIKEEKHHRIYLFTFTDAYFENGEPIE